MIQNNRFKARLLFVPMVSIILVSIFFSDLSAMDKSDWTAQELAVLRSMWIGSLPALPKDPSNKYSDDPKVAAFGKKLFFDARFSGNMKVSCATCHRDDYSFSDNLPLSHGMGTTSRRSMPLIGSAYNAWFFWDGRKDSLWSQALGPIESQVEHGISRTMSAYIINTYHRDDYMKLFGDLPEITEENWPQNARPADDDPRALKAWVLMGPERREEVNRIYVNMGKAIAAYVRTIVPEPSPFDKYVEQLIEKKDENHTEILTDDELAGLRLFIGKAKCTNCHNGPLLTNGDFHNIGLKDKGNISADKGRAEGISLVLADEFNCLGRYSDADPQQCYELRYIDTSDKKYVGAFKTPTLRNVADRGPYMHAGQFATLSEVLQFYKRSKNPDIGHQELTNVELKQLEAFLRTLSSPLKSL